MVRRSQMLLWGAVLLCALTGYLTYRSHYRWVGHALFTIVGLVTLGWTVTTGAILTRRLPSRMRGIFPLHRLQGIAFGLLMLFSIPYGLLSVQRHGEPYLSSAHGKLGVVIGIIAVVQVVPSLLTLKRTRLRLPHRIIGYLMMVLLLLQTVTGLQAGVMAAGEDLVFSHTLLGLVSLVASVLIVTEMRYPGMVGMRRAEIAAWAAAGANITGCWLLGGTYSVREFDPRMLRHILASDRPWAVSVALAAKQDVFLYLPITSLVLALALGSLCRHDRLPLDAESRKVVVGVGVLNITLVLLVAVLGMLVSDAGRVTG